MYYTRNDIMKINNFFGREENINFWGVPEFWLYKTGGRGGGGGASGKDPGPKSQKSATVFGHNCFLFS